MSEQQQHNTIPGMETGGVPIGTPASEWSSDTLAALTAPGKSNTNDLRGSETTAQQFATPSAADLTAPTAQTSGFTPVAMSSSGLGGLGSSPNVPQPGASGHSEGMTMDQKLAASTGFTGGLGGGLASSPLVPRPGTSGHSEGLTMAEFQAKKAAEVQASAASILARSNIEAALGPNAAGGAGPLSERTTVTVVSQLDNLSLENNRPVPASTSTAAIPSQHESSTLAAASAPPQSESLLATSGLDDEALKGLSGREQAARQLSAGLGIPQGAVGTGPAGLRDHGVAGTTGPIAPEQVGGPSLAGFASALGLKPPHNRTMTEELATPGKELPGAWGPVEPVPAPGTSSHAPTSIYEDVQTALHAAGKSAFSALPTGVVEKLSGHKADGTPIEQTQSLRTGELSPPQGRRGSVAAIFDTAKQQVENAKQQVNHLIHDAGEVINPPRRESQPHVLNKSSAPEPERQRRASTMSNTSAGGGEGIIDKARDLIGGVLGSGAAALGPLHPRKTSVTGIAPATSLPSSEVTGSHPGDRSGGVGALPGSIEESGVAVLPDVRANPNPLESSKASQDLSVGPKGTESTVLPVERGQGSSGIAGGVAHPVIAAEPAPSGSTVPEPHVDSAIGHQSTGHNSLTSDAPLAAPASAPPSGSHVPEPSMTDSAYGLGASNTLAYYDDNTSTSTDKDTRFDSYDATATDTRSESTVVDPAVFHSGATPDDTTAPATGASDHSTLEKFGLGAPIAGGGAAVAAAGFAAQRHEGVSPPVHDRSDSSASVMAIRHGTPGTKSHELPPAAAGLQSVEEGENVSTRDSTPVTSAKSLTPGNEHEGVGHPSTRDQPGSTREPGAAYSGSNEGITSLAPGSEVKSAAHPAAHDFPHDTSKVSHEGSRLASPSAAAPPATPPKDIVATPSSSHSTSAASPTPPSPASSKIATSGHKRTDSNSSGKRGLFDKIKEKLHHGKKDEAGH